MSLTLRRHPTTLRRQPSAATLTMRTHRLFPLYLAAVIVGGAAVCALAARDDVGIDAIVDRPLVFAVLTGLLVIGELRPVRLLRLPTLSEEPPPPSTTFVFALLLVFGLPGALAAQGFASLVDDLR